MEHRHRHSSIFENVRNFLVAVQEIGIHIFEASDLEQGEKSSRIGNGVLALKSYSEWKQTGAKVCGNLVEHQMLAVSMYIFMLQIQTIHSNFNHTSCSTKLQYQCHITYVTTI